MSIIHKLEDYLHHEGNEHLTIILLGLVLLGFLVALFAPPEMKLFLIMWWLFP